MYLVNGSVEKWYRNGSESRTIWTTAHCFLTPGGGLLRGVEKLVRVDIGGGGSNFNGKPEEASQRARVDSSKPVNPRSERRTIVNSLGDVNVASVMVLPR